jgi:hypothetical protein
MPLRCIQNVEVKQCSATGVPPQGFRCVANFYKKMYIRTLYLEKGNMLYFVIRIRNICRHARTHTHARTHRFIIDSFIQHVLCFVFICLHSYRARIYMQIHIYGHV